MKTIEILLAEIENEKKRLDDRAKVLQEYPIEKLEAAFPAGVFAHYSGQAYKFSLPMSFELIAQFKEFIKVEMPEWKFSNEWQSVWDNGHGGHFISLQKDYVYLDIDFRIEREGATCTVKQIGYEQKPVFEIICNEGAKEDTFGDAK